MIRIASILLCWLVLAPLAWAGFDDGAVALRRGDYETALREFRSLAKQGHAEAQFILGTMYEYGDGVRKDNAEAVKWYRMAANHGHAAARTYIGVRFLQGQGVPQDFAAAAKWFRLAAEQGWASAQMLLGSMYLEGQSVPQDYVLAHKWLNLSAAQGELASDSVANLRDMVAARMTPADILKAQRLAREWLAKHGRAN